MTQHAYVRVAGFQLALISRAPFQLRYAHDESDEIDVEYVAPGGQLFARLIPDNGGYRSKLDQHTSSLFDVLDVESGPYLDHWEIQTSAFRCCWPRDYAVCSNSYSNDPGPFDFIDHSGQTWRQRHVVVTRSGRRIAITMQAPTRFAVAAGTATHMIAQSLAVD